MLYPTELAMYAYLRSVGLICCTTTRKARRGINLRARGYCTNNNNVVYVLTMLCNATSHNKE
eukprot:scaffold534207_cov14-Prasinocladus_malaysianus.AAC.1